METKIISFAFLVEQINNIRGGVGGGGGENTQLCTVILPAAYLGFYLRLGGRAGNRSGPPNGFLVVFFFEKTTYCCRARRLSVCPSVRLSSVEIISFRGNSLSNRPINLKIGLNVREGVVHVRKV